MSIYDNQAILTKEQRMSYSTIRPTRFIDQFLNHFQPLFSKTRMRALRQLVCAMFFDYKRLSLTSVSKRLHSDYQKLQYFFSESSFKSKLDLARELIEDALDKKIPFSAVVFDAWYTSTDLIEFIASKNIYLVAETKINRSILFTHPVTKQAVNTRADKIIPLIKQYFSGKLKAVSIPQSDGSVKSVLTYTLKSKLKDCSTPLQIFFVFDKWSSTDDKDVHILITNNLTMSAENAILTYLLRWGIEESFRELKDDFCFDQYQVRHQEQIQRHWIMSFLAWSLAYWIKQNACLSKIFHEPPNSISQCKEAVAALIIIDSAMLLSKNPDAAQFRHIKSQRFRQRLEN